MLPRKSTSPNASGQSFYFIIYGVISANTIKNTDTLYFIDLSSCAMIFGAYIAISIRTDFMESQVTWSSF